MTPPQIETAAIAGALGLACAFGLDRLCWTRRIYPPGFLQPWRRWLALLILAVFLALGVFLPLAAAVAGAGIEPPNLSKIGTFQLFELHLIMVVVMGLWFLLGFAGRPVAARVETLAPVPPVPYPLAQVGMEAQPLEQPPPPSPSPSPSPPSPPVPLGQQLMAQFGFLALDVPREIGLGLLLGLAAWLAVIAALLAIAAAVLALGGENVLPKNPPALVPLIAALPFGVRFAVALSAGVVEETFFRGFLQPRLGIVLSTALFAIAHLSYGSLFMLVGITLLSLIYALLVRWRQSVWAAIAAHALFDGVQLLVVIPAVLKLTHGAVGKAVAYLGLLG